MKADKHSSPGRSPHAQHVAAIAASAKHGKTKMTEYSEKEKAQMAAPIMGNIMQMKAAPLTDVSAPECARMALDCVDVLIQEQRARQVLAEEKAREKGRNAWPPAGR